MYNIDHRPNRRLARMRSIGIFCVLFDRRLMFGVDSIILKRLPKMRHLSNALADTTADDEFRKFPLAGFEP